jgi:hypothetical protein
MRIGIVAIAAVRVCSVAVTLDLAGRGALEATGTGRKARGCACSDVVRQAGDVSWIAHEDCGFDLGDGRRLDGNCGVGYALIGIATTTKSVVKDLATL